MAGNFWKWLDLPDMAEMAGTGWNWLEMAGIAGNLLDKAEHGLKFLELALNGWK